MGTSKQRGPLSAAMWLAPLVLAVSGLCAPRALSAQWPPPPQSAAPPPAAGSAAPAPSSAPPSPPASEEIPSPSAPPFGVPAPPAPAAPNAADTALVPENSAAVPLPAPAQKPAEAAAPAAPAAGLRAAPVPARSADTEAQANPLDREPNPLSANRSWLGAGAALGVANLPKLGAGLELVGEVRAASLWPIDIALVYWFENDAVLTANELDLRLTPLLGFPFPEAGSRFRFNAVQLSAAVCPYEHDLTTGSLLLCAGLQGGLTRVRSEGFIAPVETTRPQLALDLYARWHFRLSETVGVSYSAGAFVPLLHDSFGYRDRFGAFHQKFRTTAVGARLDLAVTYGF